MSDSSTVIESDKEQPASKSGKSTFFCGLMMAAVAGYSVGFAVFGFRRKKTFVYLYNPKSDKC